MLAPNVRLKVHNSMMNLPANGHVLNLLQDATLVKIKCHGNILPAEITIRTAGPGRNQLFDVIWLAVEEVYQQVSGTEAPQHSTRFTHLPNFQAS